jgi:hypothetical protein
MPDEFRRLKKTRAQCNAAATISAVVVIDSGLNNTFKNEN